jgi:transmembrane sensor
MKNKRLEYLLESYVAKNTTAAEETELFKLLGSEENDEQVKTFMQQAWHQPGINTSLSDEQSQVILSSVLEREKSKVVPLATSRFRRGMIWAAASVAIFAAGILLFYLLNKNADTKTPLAKNTTVHPYNNDVAPGTSGAVLKLSNGSSIILDNATDGQLAKQDNIQVIKQGGSVQYIAENKNGEDAVSYNVIETPRGRQYRLLLEDGTRVWLNAASSIRFPVAFSGSERRVAITGEVYFEVAKNKEKPFRVEAAGTTVEVLGTHFNINSYPDEETINTTLLEGSVKVVKDRQVRIIKPGQQAQVNAKGEMKMGNNVNLTEVMAWKDNLFSFNNTDIKKLMRQLSRWYDVEVEFKNDTQETVTFIGGISRSVNLSTVLNMLEQTGEVKFDIEGKKIIVKM